MHDNSQDPVSPSALDAALEADERLQAELDFAEYVLGWRPEPSAFKRITFSGDGRWWTVYDRDHDDPKARQVALYDAENPRCPDYAAAQRWNRRRQDAVSYYARLATRRRKQARCRIARRPVVMSIPTTARRTPRARGAGRPAARRAAGTRSGIDPGDEGSSDSDPHDLHVAPVRPALRAVVVPAPVRRYLTANALSIRQVRWCDFCGIVAPAVDDYQQQALDRVGFTALCPDVLIGEARRIAGATGGRSS